MQIGFKLAAELRGWRVSKLSRGEPSAVGGREAGTARRAEGEDSTGAASPLQHLHPSGRAAGAVLPGAPPAGTLGFACPQQRDRRWDRGAGASGLRALGSGGAELPSPCPELSSLSPGFSARRARVSCCCRLQPVHTKEAAVPQWGWGTPGIWAPPESPAGTARWSSDPTRKQLKPQLGLSLLCWACSRAISPWLQRLPVSVCSWQ